MLLQLLVLAVASVQADLSVDIDASSVLHAANPLYMVRCRGFVHIYCGRGSSGDMEHPVVVVVRITVLLAHHTHTTTCTHTLTHPSTPPHTSTSRNRFSQKGCHSDSGFVHEVRGWSSQMIFGESFESPPNGTKPGQSSYAWQSVVDASLGSRATIALDTTRPFAGQASQRISIAAAAGGAFGGAGGTAGGTAGVANRGLGNEGLYLQAGKEYEGYFFASSDAAVTLEVRLETTDGTVLARQQIQHQPSTGVGGVGGGYAQHKFSLTPSAGTECVGIAPDSDPTVHCTSNPGTAHVCIKCGGQFTVALVAPSATAANDAGKKAGGATVNIDYVVLQPGLWGRFKGLNARKDVADTLATMGIKIIRLGGSFCSVTPDR